jgi:exonuclease III
MPYYKPLKTLAVSERKRIVANLLELRKKLDQEMPTKKISESVILGTWNIRNFDDNRFNNGPRREESFYYIAEIIERFDVIAVQEICNNLGPLNKLMGVLGGNYDYILTDVTHKDLGGNEERLGFIYDKSKVHFKGIAGEIVLPPKMLVTGAKGEQRQFSRTPFGCSFQAGWFKFLFNTVHIYFGSAATKSKEYERRVQEIDKVAKYLSEEADLRDDNYILVGDFNIIGPGSRDYNALGENGFTIIQNKKGSNDQQTKFYDQISFKSRKNELHLTDSDRSNGVFQFFDVVFSNEKFKSYGPFLQKETGRKIALAEEELKNASTATKRREFEKQILSLKARIASDTALEEYYREWRTFQMSDHLPLWVELKIDFSNEYLAHLSSFK